MVVPILKRMEIIMSIQVCLISRMDFDYKENSRKKTFLGNPKHQYRVSQCGELDCSAIIIKRMEIIMSIQVCLTSWMNFDYRENEGKKGYPCKSKASTPCIPMRRT